MDSQPAPAAQRSLSQVEAELHEIRQRVERLTDRVLALETGVSRPAVDPDAASGPREVAGSNWSWLAHSGALQRVATISFVLVVALVLRTLTDGGIVDQALGIRLGIAYALARLMMEG